MTEPSGPGHVIPFWPIWTRTLDTMIRSLARARSRCRQCRISLHVDLDAMRMRLGGSASLIDRSDACAVVGCGGTVYYLGAPAAGAGYHVLIDRPALLDGVGDPVGRPFRSRWHGMVAIGPVPLPAPAPADIVELHRHPLAGRRHGGRNSPTTGSARHATGAGMIRLDIGTVPAEVRRVETPEQAT